MVEYSTDLPHDEMGNLITENIPDEDEILAITNKKKGNRLCFISLGLYLAFLFMSLVIVPIYYITLKSQLSVNYGSSLLGSFGTLFGFFLMAVVSGIFIASIVFMIIARVKYPKNKFGLILMIAYIAIQVITILAGAIITISVVGMAVYSIGELIQDFVQSF